MAEVPQEAFFNYFLFLLVPFIFGFLARRINISPVIGYILGGIVLGNFFETLISREAINNFALFGIILLLFTIGLEVNLSKLDGLKRYILFGGILQIVLTAAATTILSLFFGFSLIHAVLIGIALTSSSTAIVAKIIQERGEEGSFLGEIVLGVLMLQDLAFIPFVILYVNISGQSSASFWLISRNIAVSFLESGFILWAMYYFGKNAIPYIFNRISRLSRELLNLFIIVFIFMIAFLTANFGIPVLVGAFIAGILVSQTSQHYHIFSQVRPLRDILAIIFFVYIGSQVVLSKTVFIAPKIIIFSLMFAAMKAAIILIIFLFLRFSTRMAFYMAAFLFQASENAFILLSLAFANKIFTQDEYVFVISSILFTLILTPFLINKKEAFYLGMRGFFKRYVPSVHMFIRHRVDFDSSPIDVFSLKNHVIICGFGRIGARVGRALVLAKIPFIAIDYNYQTVERVKKEGVNIVYGDPTDLDVLDFAEAEHASVLVSTMPHRLDQESVILNVKKLNPKIFIVSRVHTEKEQERLKDLGAHSVVQPELEASLSIIKKVFIINNIEHEEAARMLRHIKLIKTNEPA